MKENQMKIKEQYKTKIENIPDEHKSFFIELNKKIDKAYRNPMKIIRSIGIGCYLVFNGEELISISYYNHDKSKKLYICKEYHDAWVWDPSPSLKSIRASLGVK